MAAITQSDDEESGSKEEVEPKEVANLYLMVHKEENEVSASNSSLFTFNELQDAFDDLMFEFKNVGNKNILLKKMMSTLSKENEDLQKKNEVCISKESIKENSLSKVSTKEKQI